MSHLLPPLIPPSPDEKSSSHGHALIQTIQSWVHTPNYLSVRLWNPGALYTCPNYLRPKHQTKKNNSSYAPEPAEMIETSQFLCLLILPYLFFWGENTIKALATVPHVCSPPTTNLVINPYVFPWCPLCHGKTLLLRLYYTSNFLLIHNIFKT